MNIYEMTKEDFNNIPTIQKKDLKKKFSSMIIIPEDYEHESGYMCMSFVAVNKNGEPMFKCGGGSDVIHIDGIGGYGYNWIYRPDNEKFKNDAKGWSIDCIPCGYLRLFCVGSMFFDEMILSDCQVYGEKKCK